MSANWEQRSLHSFGSKFRLDIANPQTTTSGNQVFEMVAVTEEEEDVNLVGLGENGDFHVYNDKTIEIVGGQKASSSGVDILIAGRNGDICINADRNGRVRIRGKDIVIQADEDVDITAGRNLTLKSGSGRILLKGNTLEEEGLKGNLLPDELQWAWRVYEGTGMPGYAFPALVSPFSGITNLAGTLVGSPQLFTGIIDNAVSGAISQATGGLVDGSVIGIANDPLGAASGALSNATGGASDIITDLLP